MSTFDNHAHVKTIGSKNKDRICVMVMNQDQNQDFDFELILNKEGKSSKTLVIHADAFLDRQISGTIGNQTTVLLVPFPLQPQLQSAGRRTLSGEDFPK